MKKRHSPKRKASNRRLLAVTGMTAMIVAGWAGAALAGSTNWAMPWTSSVWESPRWSNSVGGALVQQFDCQVTHPWDGSPAIEWELWEDISFWPDDFQGNTLFTCNSTDQNWNPSAANGNLYIKFVGIEGTSATANGHASS